MSKKRRESQIRLKKAKLIQYKSQVARVKHVLKKTTDPSSSPLICPSHSALSFHPVVLTLPPLPRLVTSQGTSDPGSGGRGELPGEAGAGHSQTAERGGLSSAGAGQGDHRTAPAAAAAATSGKEPPPSLQWAPAQAQILPSV